MEGLNSPREIFAPLEARLDELAIALAAGAPAQIEQQAALLLPEVKALGGLVEAGLAEAARQGAGAGDLKTAAQAIRRRLATIRELLEHGEQAHGALAGILGLYYGAQNGSQYSARGEPALPSVVRVVAEA
jgi:hypothetical protein